MPEQLYKVAVTQWFYVLAESGPKACNLLDESVESEAIPAPIDTESEYEAVALADVPEGELSDDVLLPTGDVESVEQLIARLNMVG